MQLTKSLIVGLVIALGASSSAFAQCSGQPAAGKTCANATASPTIPSWVTMSALLDRNFGGPSTQGTILNRGASVWSATATPTLGLNGGTGGSLTLNGATTGSAIIGVKAAAGSTIFNLPVGNGTVNQVLSTDGSGNTSWTTAGAGTVSSVGLSMPGIFSVTNSPVTGAGTLTAALNNQSANLVWAGPSTGAASAPTFRALVGADLPNPTSGSLGGIQSFVAVGSQWIRQISTSGVPTASQPAFTDISGTVDPTQCPNPSASTIGCVESLAAVTSKWINTISTSGVPSATQPNFTDIAGLTVLGQLPSISNNSIIANNSGGTSTPAALGASTVLDMLGSTQGTILYRNASVWVPLGVGSDGQVLTTHAAAANPTWTTVTGTGTVTDIGAGTGIVLSTTPLDITTTGTISLANIADKRILANVSGGSAAPTANTMSSLLDIIGSTTGDILYRAAGGTGWQALAPGTNGQVLTQGASTPSWSNAGSVSNVVISAGSGLGSSGTCNITTTGTCSLALASALPSGIIANSIALGATGTETVFTAGALSGDPAIIFDAYSASNGGAYLQVGKASPGSGRNNFITLNAPTSGSNGGAYIQQDNDGTFSWALGNVSGINGGAYDATNMLRSDHAFRFVVTGVGAGLMTLDSSGNLSSTGIGAWTSYSPSVASVVGTITTSSATGRYRQVGKTVTATATVTITNKGTGAGSLLVGLPVTAFNSNYAGASMEVAVSGKSGPAIIFGGGTTMSAQAYDGTTTFIANGAIVVLTITYEAS